MERGWFRWRAGVSSDILADWYSSSFPGLGFVIQPGDRDSVSLSHGPCLLKRQVGSERSARGLLTRAINMCGFKH